jgi:cyclopropane fatty-acyl-phospholipid synthase-like methyltransferase
VTIFEKSVTSKRNRTLYKKFKGLKTSLALATRLRFILEGLRINGAESVLDIGCGTGKLLTNYTEKHYPKLWVTGVDTD